ncbi:ABC transporter permease subunit, partial [candidate division KSB3 bacterium]|nr:ABC transporter permease subunit [candidate division KSB3 bacterium]MBD3326300.1 ABC transporter permease subunit [candidate division KSB3 bacterium]
MRWTDFSADVQEFWQEFRRVPSGVMSLILLGVFILISVLEPYLLPFPEANTRWRDITYWEDNPRSMPPVWINWVSSKRRAKSVELREPTMSEGRAGTMTRLKALFTYHYAAEIPPVDLIFHCQAQGSPAIMLSMIRPDGETLDLFRKPISAGKGKAVRISIDKDAKSQAYTFGARVDSPENRLSKDMLNPTSLLFAQAQEGIFRHPEPLPGTYTLVAEAILPKQSDHHVEDLYFSLPGSVAGLMGTDNSKRDIWSGVVAGVKWALLIGLLTALIAVSIGVVYGVVSAYFGGWVDSLMQRIFEVFVSIPLLPLLIVMSAIFKPSIWTLIIMMSCFFWVGPVKTVRSIGLQIKEETYIEASQAFGASSLRIIFKHMIPLLVPYAFASMALYVPGAIVYESTISLLGLGDSTIVTWGQILHDALSGGAVLNGQWWWVIPPGLAI